MAIPHEAEYRPGDEDPEVLRTFTSSRIGGGKNARSEPMKVRAVYPHPWAELSLIDLILSFFTSRLSSTSASSARRSLVSYTPVNLRLSPLRSTLETTSLRRICRLRGKVFPI
jgi:hypothetical protein